MDRAAVVVGRAAEIVEFENYDFTAGVRHVWVGHAGGETTDAIVNLGCGRGVVNVDEIVRGEVRIEGDAQQAALAIGINRQRHKGCCQQRAISDNPQLSALLANKDAAVRRKSHGGGIAQTVGDQCFGEIRGNVAALTE